MGRRRADLSAKLGCMKSVLFAKTKSKPARPIEAALSFVPVGADDGRPVPDALERLAAFHERHPETRRALRKGQKGTVELVRETRDRR